MNMPTRIDASCQVIAPFFDEKSSAKRAAFLEIEVSISVVPRWFPEPISPITDRPSAGEFGNHLRGLVGGAEGNRTPDLCSAIAALSHLSYSPDTIAA